MAKNLALRLFMDLEKRWGDMREPAFNPNVQYGFLKRQIGIHRVFCLASFLDPRFKKLGFLKHAHDRQSIWDAMAEEMLKVINENTFDFKDTQEEPDEDITTISEGSIEDDPLHRYMGRITRGQQGTNDDPLSKEDKIKMELNHYKNEVELPLFTGGERNCPLQWWKDRQKKFPILSRLARIYLAVQATSASSERVFSKAERVISKKRTNLDPARAGSLIWLAAILKQEPVLSLPFDLE